MRRFFVTLCFSLLQLSPMWGVGRAADLFLSRPDEVVEKAVCPLPSQPGEAVGEQATGEVQTHGAEEEGFEGET